MAAILEGARVVIGANQNLGQRGSSMVTDNSILEDTSVLSRANRGSELIPADIKLVSWKLQPI